MAKRLNNALVALIALAAFALAATLFSLPARAWDASTSTAAGCTLIPEDATLFEGTELSSIALEDLVQDWEQEYAIYTMAGQASGLSGTLRSANGYALYLSAEGTQGSEPIDLSAPENADLADAQVTLESYVGNSLEDVLDGLAAVRFDPESGAFARAEGYALEIRETQVDGTPADGYWFVYEGRLADLMGFYILFSAVDYEAPIAYAVSEDPYVEHDFWSIGVNIEDGHVGFEPLFEEDGDILSPMGCLRVDGPTMYRFDGALGFKFIVPTEPGYVTSVLCTIGGETVALEPTDETATWSGDSKEYPVYQVPPTDAAVMLTLSAHLPAYTFNGDGTISFEAGYYPDASLLSFDLPEGVRLIGAIDYPADADSRSAFAVFSPWSQATGGYDYYCWPDKPSGFSFEVPEGLAIEAAEIIPAEAGTAEVEGTTVSVTLSAPATLRLSLESPAGPHIDTDPVTGVSVAIAPEDAQLIDWDSLTLYVGLQEDISYPQETQAAIRATLGEDDAFSPDELVSADVWYVDAEGAPALGGLEPSEPLAYGAEVTLPLPDGWDAASVRVFQYYAQGSEDDGPIFVAEREFAVSEDGKSIVVKLPSQLGRIVLAREVYVPEPHAPGWDTDETGAYVYYKDDGTIMVNDWAPYGASHYYMDSKGHVLTSGIAYYAGTGKYYLVDASGRVDTTPGWHKPRFVYYYVKSDGSVVVGDWLKLNGTYYYFGDDGVVYSNRWLTYGGKRYYFGPEGKLYVSQWLRFDDTYYYFGADGAAYESQWLNYGGAWYYFGEDGKVYVNQKLDYGGAGYYFGADGKLYVSRWLSSDGSWYYFGSDGKLVRDKWVNVGGTWYHFNAEGVCDDSRSA